MEAGTSIATDGFCEVAKPEGNTYTGKCYTPKGITSQSVPHYAFADCGNLFTLLYTQ